MVSQYHKVAPRPQKRPNLAKHTQFLEIKKTVYACLLTSEGGDSFRRLLDLAVAPNKTNEGVQKQWNIQ